jgi:xylulokinase
MSKVLTFDLGTTYFKVCLFDEAAKLIACGRAAVPVVHSAAGRAELPVDSFRRYISDLVHEVGQQAGGLGDVTRISFASQANSFTLLNSNDEPLVPFILWSDQRARGLDASLRDFTARAEFFATTGVPELDYQFLPAKILWLQQFQPHIMSEARRLCCISDYLVWWLTGNHLAEAGLAGLTGLVDIHRLRYWPEALQRIQLPEEWLPAIVRAEHDVGPLRREPVEELGLPEDCRLIMGCLDQYSGAIGAGNVEPGGVSETTGTVLATIRCTARRSTECRPGVFQGPSFAEGIYYEMAFSELSAGLLERYRNALPDRPSFAELDAWASAVPAGAEGLRLSPDAARKTGGEMFVNRAPFHTRGHEVRAMLEAVAQELRRQVALLCGDAWPSIVRAAGGGANSKLWLAIKSDVLGCPVQAVECAEPTSLGAAMLALGRIDSGT